MAGPVTDPRVHTLRNGFHAAFAAPDLPVSVEAVAEDLLGLHVEEAEIDCSEMLVPTERRVVLRAAAPPARRRFTLVPDVGHWVCQVREGHEAPSTLEPLMSRREPTERWSGRQTCSPRSCRCRSRRCGRNSCGRRRQRSWFGVSEEAMSWRLFNLGLGQRP